MAETDDLDALRNLATGSDHPYATGFLVTNADGSTTALDRDQPLPLAGPAGNHRPTVAITTPYGTLAAQPLHYVLR